MLGGYLILRGMLTAGMLISAVSLISRVTDGIGNIVEYINAMLSTKPLRQKFEKHLISADETLGRAAFLPPPQQDVVLHLRNLSFGFDTQMILKDTNACFQRGGCYAILGESGVGKSTLAKLMMGFYSDFKGEILLDGLSIGMYPEGALYERIGFVPQSTFIFRDSLFNNICMYREEDAQSNHSYEQLMKLFNLTHLTLGRTNQEVDAEQLSGGEKQRIGLARVLFRGASTIIFDEPTSGLDPQNASQIMHHIFGLNNITRLVITHNWDQEFLGKFDAVFRIADSTLNPIVL